VAETIKDNRSFMIMFVMIIIMFTKDVVVLSWIFGLYFYFEHLLRFVFAGHIVKYHLGSWHLQPSLLSRPYHSLYGE
jgi:hypothetical protein